MRVNLQKMKIMRSIQTDEIYALDQHCKPEEVNTRQTALEFPVTAEGLVMTEAQLISLNRKKKKETFPECYDRILYF